MKAKIWFDRIFLENMEVRELDTVVLLSHQHPDGDAVGSVLGMAHYLKDIYNKFRVIPYLEDTIETGVKSFLEKDDFQPFNVPELSEHERYCVIVLDTPGEDRIAGKMLYENAALKIVIDHHIGNTGYGDINLIHVSDACAENIFFMIDWISWLEKSDCLDCHPNLADYVYLGLIHDTSSLNRGHTSTFEAIYKLSVFGVDHSDIMNTFHPTFNCYMTRMAIMEKVKKLDNKVAYIYLTREDIKELNIEYEDIHPISSILRDCRDINVGLTMHEEDDNIWKISIRSDGKTVDVNKVMKKFSGGGHTGAASLRIRIKDKNPEKLLEEILNAVSEALKLK